MSKKILILAGSPRRNGNSDMLIDAFVEGAKGHEIIRYDLYDMKLGGCRACNGCWNSKGNCVFKDDMAAIQESLEEADVLVVATPLYWSMVTAPLKAVIDRFYQYDPANGGKKLEIKESILLTTGETENDEDFYMIKNFFEGMCEFNGMKVIDMISVPNVNFKGDIKGNDALSRARELGASL